jgi:hypothetical protein
MSELTPLDLAIVLDRTGTEGLFDVALVWNPQIQELLTLRPETGPVEVIVVGRVQRPTPDQLS